MALLGAVCACGVPDAADVERQRTGVEGRRLVGDMDVGARRRRGREVSGARERRGSERGAGGAVADGATAPGRNHDEKR